MPEGTPDHDRVSSHSDADGIEIVRTFDAPRELVFEAWTRAEAWAAWFGEPGSSIPPDRISMDARPGGRWSLVMIYGPEEVELPFSGEFREVVEPQRIVLTLTDAEHPDGAQAEVVTIVLRDLGDDRTEVTFTQRGGNLSPEQYEQAMRGWLVFLERQSDYLKMRHDTP